MLFIWPFCVGCFEENLKAIYLSIYDIFRANKIRIEK